MFILWCQRVEKLVRLYITYQFAECGAYTSRESLIKQTFVSIVSYAHKPSLIEGNSCQAPLNAVVAHCGTD